MGEEWREERRDELRWLGGGSGELCWLEWREGSRAVVTDEDERWLGVGEPARLEWREGGRIVATDEVEWWLGVGDPARLEWREGGRTVATDEDERWLGVGEPARLESKSMADAGMLRWVVILWLTSCGYRGG